jgi:3-hydroxyacyl-CoA dehydrogenase
MVMAGNLGKKSGTGFYEYKTDNKDLLVAANFRR